MQDNIIDFKNIFEAMPGKSALINALTNDFEIIAVTDDYVNVAGVSRDKLIGDGIFTNFPQNPDYPESSGESRLRSSFTACISDKKTSGLPVHRYDLITETGAFNEKYWSVTNKPLLKNDTVAYIIHTVEDVTELMISQQKNRQIKHLEQAHNLFMQASTAIHILSGPNMIVELANQPTLKMWGKDNSVIGKPLLDILPEFESQGIIEIIHNVRLSGISNTEFEMPIMTFKNGADEIAYYNFVTQPYYEEGEKNAVGVLIIASDVTDQVLGRKELLQKEKNLELALNANVETQHELEKSAQKLRSFIESAPFPIGIYIGREMRIELVNQSILDVWGRTDVVGKLYSEVLPELESQEIYPQLERVFNTGEAFHAKNQRINLVHNNKLETFYFNYSFTPLFDAFGNVYGVMNTAADVTDLNFAMQKVEESEYRYRTLIEESSVAAALYRGEDLKIQYANQIMLDFWGRDESIIGLPFRTAVPELEDQEFPNLLENVFKTGIEYVGSEEKATLLVNGKLQDSYFNFTYKPLRNHEGKIYGIHHMAVDVTNEVLIKKELEKSENNFRATILQAPVAICIFRGKDYVFEVVNAMMEEMLGRKSTVLVGKPFFEAMPEMQNAGLKPILDGIMQNGNSYKSEDQEFHLPDGDTTKIIYASYIYEPIKDANGVVQSIIVVASDVTQQVYSRKRIEEIVTQRTKALAEANKNLKDSNAELEQFAYIASHDLQEPLRKISIFGKMLEESLENVTDRSLTYMNKINYSTQRMSNLIKDILGYSQLSKDSEVFRKVDLNKSLKGIISDYELIIEQKGASLHWSELPVIEAIPLQISQLFSNLISNSLKYSQDNVSPEISISATIASEQEVESHKLPDPKIKYAKITFTDNGIGFKEEYAERIFNIFQRLHGKTDYEGTGIGLAMCKKIAQNHHGTIFAEGSDTFGAKFVLILPIKQSKK